MISNKSNSLLVLVPVGGARNRQSRGLEVFFWKNHSVFVIMVPTITASCNQQHLPPVARLMRRLPGDSIDYVSRSPRCPPPRPPLPALSWSFRQPASSRQL